VDIRKERTLKTPLDSKSRLPWSFGIALWATVVLTGFATTWRYSSTEGSATAAPIRWPASSRLHRATGRHTLVMFVHAHCSCSMASLVELARTINRVRGRMSTIVIFVRPEGIEPDRVEAILRSQASVLTDTVVVDDDGDEMERFGARTSGATLLFDRAGTLVFTGGLTSIRGHEGDSLGQERIVSLVQAGVSDRSDSPVFGCALEDNEEGR